MYNIGLSTEASFRHLKSNVIFLGSRNVEYPLELNHSQLPVKHRLCTNCFHISSCFNIWLSFLKLKRSSWLQCKLTYIELHRDRIRQRFWIDFLSSGKPYMNPPFTDHVLYSARESQFFSCNADAFKSTSSLFLQLVGGTAHYGSYWIVHRAWNLPSSCEEKHIWGQNHVYRELFRGLCPHWGEFVAMPYVNLS